MLINALIYVQSAVAAPIIFGDFSRQARVASKPQIPMLWELATKSLSRFEGSSIISPIGNQELNYICTQIHIPNYQGHVYYIGL